MLYIDPAYQQQTFVSAIGEQKVVTLMDGSQIQLNTHSRLNVSYHLLSRKVDLQQGEATFHVKHNPWHAVIPWLERSFNVYADDIRIQDIGTIFNVRRLDHDDVQVAVLEGQVRIHTVQQNPLDLTTGQSINTQHGQYHTIDHSDVTQLTAWQQGYLYFNDRPLAQVLAEINRYGQLPVSIKDKTIAELRVSGQVDLKDRQQFIHALPTFAPVKLQYLVNGKIIIHKK
ncbi:hypothetical protein GWI33_009909 [Rhynchophorus ferrugineus]|uniref:FecR protein domain-containing protein n=1 Tax=Rhynchophorus ferrugineus TaxID=354439 RepID=A0A834IEP6_RHYFE|nr:hypothetical protein GWI33_009909 [Rhynchophorus ferrugineus]